MLQLRNANIMMISVDRVNFLANANTLERFLNAFD